MGGMSRSKSLFVRALLPAAVAIGYCGFVLKGQIKQHDDRRLEIDEERRKDKDYEKNRSKLGDSPK